MADSIKSPTKFDGLNFLIWKVKMTVFFTIFKKSSCKTVTKPFSIPDGNEDTWSDVATKELDVNTKAHYDLL